MSIATWKLQLYWSQDVVASPVKLCEPLSGLCVSCRQLKDDEHCWRWPAVATAPSLNCRWYEWKGSESLGPRPGAVSDPGQWFSSSLYLLLTAAVLRLNVLLSCWVKQTSLPSSACGMPIETVNTNYSRCYLPWMHWKCCQFNQGWDQDQGTAKCESPEATKSPLSHSKHTTRTAVSAFHTHIPPYVINLQCFTVKRALSGNTLRN